MGCTPAKPAATPLHCPNTTCSQRNNSLDQHVMGKYIMSLRKKDTLGHGSFSSCYRGFDTETGASVAIKVYKIGRHGERRESPDPVMLKMFRRQVSVLKELQEPFPVTKSELWNEELSQLQPSDLFMRLLDYSRDENGEPGPDPREGVLCIVTELAQYSLRDFLELHRSAARPLPPRIVQAVARAVMTAVAGLHTKGFVHLDIKPSNLMVFDGRLKLIDIDGCVRAGTLVSKTDLSISFSPFYCAPEFARFLTQSSDHPIQVAPSLDVWSTGMTICEVMHLTEVLRPKFEMFEEQSSEHEAGFLFMKWLGRTENITLPRSVSDLDAELRELLSGRLLVCEEPLRASLAQCLSRPGRAAAPPWSFPSRLGLAEGAGCRAAAGDAKLPEAALPEAAAKTIPADRDCRGQKESAKGSLLPVRRRISLGTSLKRLPRPRPVVDRSVHFVKSLFDTGAAAKGPDSMAPPLRNAFEEA
mmetsp:Transcript_32715/g.93967  ORF Transcript_32715/g.93967 Transcript_32715/m.93967 type:complete len:472 (+) Transcript_32715:56-1471(+)